MQAKCLSIAGFDGSGGAGMQADLKTFSATGSYGMSVLTALPIQNTMGVRNCYDIPLDCIREQLEAIFDDIRPDAIKIGMLFSSQIVELVASFLKQQAQDIPIILDPVMIAKSGDTLLHTDAVVALKNELVPIVDIITPNLPEAETLAPDHKDKRGLADAILKLGCQAVLLKGGHEEGQQAEDLFYAHNQVETFSSPRIVSKNTHGTGCTLSAAITSFMAQGAKPLQACQKGKDYLYHALKAAQYESVGHGHGPVDHFYHLWQYL